ncbi:hypothetical protein IWX90DRAFT_55858 [Phyllosticta citrichinensis]|uniref:Uncharacterized protein n=1 Tax=Phyllosticta citrichinensis TaxID=1130410 RepID=A0ABR1XIS1_9PEZI
MWSSNDNRLRRARRPWPKPRLATFLEPSTRCPPSSSQFLSSQFASSGPCERRAYVRPTQATWLETDVGWCDEQESSSPFVSLFVSALSPKFHPSTSAFGGADPLRLFYRLGALRQHSTNQRLPAWALPFRRWGASSKATTAADGNHTCSI